MTDEELVAAELAMLDPHPGQQARAEAALLRMLPIADAAAVLREEILAGLANPADDSERGWGPYLRLEAAVLRLRDIPYDRQFQGSMLWRELDIGDEPEPLRWARRLQVAALGWGWP